MQNIAAGEHAGHAGLQGAGHPRSSGNDIHLNAQAQRKFVFGDQPDGQQQGVAFYVPGLVHDGLKIFVHGRHRDLLHPVAAVNVRHCSGQVQGNVKVIQALHDVAGKAIGIGHNLEHPHHLTTFKNQAPGHDEPNVTGSQNRNALARQIAV